MFKEQQVPLFRELFSCPMMLGSSPFISRLSSQSLVTQHAAPHASCVRDSASLFCYGMAVLPLASCEPVGIRSVLECLKA